MATEIAHSLADTYMPPFRTTPDGAMLTTFNAETRESEATDVSVEMIRAHMAARVQKWINNARRGTPIESTIMEKMRHVRIKKIVGDDHLYERRVMKHMKCEICGADTRAGLDIIC